MGRKRKSTAQKSEAMQKKRNKSVCFNAEPAMTVVKRLDERKMPSPTKKNYIEAQEENYIIIKQTVLQSIISNVSCKECSESSLEVEFSKPNGFAQNIKVICNNCRFRFTNSTSNKVSDKENAFDINRRAVVAITEIGKGHAALEKFSYNMNLNCMDSKVFTRHLKLVHSSCVKSTCELLENVRTKVKQSHFVSSEAVADIAVSYDASWHKRGHTSNYSVGCIIDVLTGFVIDYEVLSKICYNCTQTANALGKDSAEFMAWYEGHAPYCDKNYEGTSGGMESEMAVRLWRRSENLGFRYTEIVSDGDAKAFHDLQALKVYGEETILTKTECINHVGKRMGTALRKLVETEKSRGVTLGGKKHGSLSEATIKKVTRYYRNAIIRNRGNISDMKKDIYAILQHCSSTDKKPKHSKCPLAEDSWCFYNRAIFLNQKPPAHKISIRTPLREDVVAKMMPIFQRLASDALLEKCTKGQTQNRNESLHNVIWGRCPKVSNASKMRVDIAAARGISDFNHGVRVSSVNALQTFFLSPANTSLIALKRIRTRHVRKALFKSTEAFKNYRKKVELAKIKINQKYKVKQGVSYAPGYF